MEFVCTTATTQSNFTKVKRSKRLSDFWKCNKVMFLKNQMFKEIDKNKEINDQSFHLKLNEQIIQKK